MGCNMQFALCCLTGDRDPTRPEYVVSDMLRPLPQLDLDLVPFDTTHEAVGAVRPALSPASDCQSDSLSLLSYATVVRGEEGDAASHVISYDDSFSSCSDSSPGGIRKRHNIPSCHLGVDKKSLQIPKGRGRGMFSSPFSDAAVGQPVSTSGYGRGGRRGQSNTLVTPPVFLGHGRGVRHGLSSDSIVGQPVFQGHGRSIRCGSSSDTSLDQSITESQLYSRLCAAAWGDHHHHHRDDLWIDPDRRQMRSGLCHSSHDQRDTEFAASCEDSFRPAERQCTPTYFTPTANGQASGSQLRSDVVQSASEPSAASAADLPSQRHQSKVVRRGGRLFCMLEQSADRDTEFLFEQSLGDGVEGDADVHVDTEVELMKFEHPTRCTVYSLAVSSLP